MGTVTFSTKSSDPHAVGYAVHSRCKVIVPPQSGCSRYVVDAVGVSAKKSLYPHTVDAVDAVGVGAKRSTHTVYSANKDGGGHYL